MTPISLKWYAADKILEMVMVTSGVLMIAFIYWAIAILPASRYHHDSSFQTPL